MQFICNTGINAHGASTAICKYAQGSTNRSRPHGLFPAAVAQGGTLPYVPAAAGRSRGRGPQGSAGAGRLWGVPAGALLKGRLQARTDMSAPPFCFM